MLNKKFFATALALVMVFSLTLFLTGDADAFFGLFDDDETYTIRAGIGLNDESAQYKGLEHFKEIVEEETDGQVEVELYHSAQLGDDVEMMENLEQGTQEMTNPSTAPMEGWVEEFSVFDLPFLFPSNEAADYVLDGPVGQRLLDKFTEETDMVALAYWENGFRQLTNSQRPVEEPADMEGLTLRTMENEIHLAAFEEMGANPTPMAFGELFSAMQQGVVDGQENPWGTIYLQNFYEVQDYATNTGHVYSPFVLLIAEEFYNDLPDEYQDIVDEAALEAKEYQRELNRDWNEEYLNELKEVMDVTILDAEEKAEFQEAVQPVYDEYADQIGADLIDEILAEIDEFQAQN